MQRLFQPGNLSLATRDDLLRIRMIFDLGVEVIDKAAEIRSYERTSRLNPNGIFRGPIYVAL